MLVNIVRWRVLKERRNEQFEVWREMMDYQRAHPEKVYYTRSRQPFLKWKAHRAILKAKLEKEKSAWAVVIGRSRVKLRVQ